MFKLIFLFLSLLFSNPLLSKEGFLPSSFKVDIVQEYESVLPGSEKRKSEGFISYQYPGKIRFEITTPDKIIFVSDSEKTWYYTAPSIEGQPGELNIGQASQSGLSNFFDALKNGLKKNEAYDVENKNKQSKITFTQSMAESLDIKSAVLYFSSDDFEFKNIEKIDLTYLDDHMTTLVFKKISLSESFKSNVFKFEAPENTRTNRLD